MDRNSITGFALIILLVAAYFFYNQHEQAKFIEQKRTDSVTYAKMHPKALVDSSKAIKQVVAADTLSDSLRKSMPAAFVGTAQTVKLENKRLALQFTSKGAYPVSAEIKGYKTYYQQPLYLFNGEGNQLSAIINNGANSTADLYFTPVVKDEPNGDKTVDFTADMGNGKKVDIVYTLPADDYMMRCDIHLTGMPANSIPLRMEILAKGTEKDDRASQVTKGAYQGGSIQTYYKNKNGDGDYFTLKNEEKTVHNDDSRSTWVGFRKQYFSTALINEDGFSKMDLKFNLLGNNIVTKDSSLIADYQGVFELPLKANGNTQSASLKWFIGPNDYKILGSYKMGLDEMVPLGYGLMAFVKYVNRFILIPIFYFLTGFITNYGVIIMVMTLFIRLILSFFTYKSYLSAAKMRVLKPELDELRAKYADDQTKFGTEQMKLYRTAGVNPMGGCLPTLFQIPILFAMYYMFPNFLEFRQQPFLWAKDLSTYDSICNLPFTIPFYGDHISLFTLLMTASSLFLALYNRNMTVQDPNNPMMKYLPFVFPIVLMGVFNKMAAALTFYYTFSNIISISMQFVIQKYFINEKAIHAQIQENKTKPATPSKWAQRMEEIQKTQQARAKGLKK